MVRNHYAGGFKSSNKAYFANVHGEFVTKALERNVRALCADVVEGAIRNRALSTERAWALPRQLRAGRCGEYAELAIHFAELLGFSAWAFVADNSACGADHAFCVFGLDSHLSEFFPLQAMCANLNVGAIVCDPWMNIVCDYAEYPSALYAKACVWSDQRKAILLHDSQLCVPVDWAGRVLSGHVTCNRLV